MFRDFTVGVGEKSWLKGIVFYFKGNCLSYVEYKRRYERKNDHADLYHSQKHIVTTGC